MNFQIRTNGFGLTRALENNLKSHLQLILSRYENAIDSVDISLSDINGPTKSGVDKRCVMTAKLSKSKSIVVQNTEADIYDAIHYCSHKMLRSLSRHLGKRRKTLRKPVRINTQLSAA